MRPRHAHADHRSPRSRSSSPPGSPIRCCRPGRPRLAGAAVGRRPGPRRDRLPAARARCRARRPDESPDEQACWRVTRHVFPWHELLTAFTWAFLVLHVVLLAVDPYANVGWLGRAGAGTVGVPAGRPSPSAPWALRAAHHDGHRPLDPAAAGGLVAADPPVLGPRVRARLVACGAGRNRRRRPDTVLPRDRAAGRHTVAHRWWSVTGFAPPTATRPRPPWPPWRRAGRTRDRPGDRRAGGAAGTRRRRDRRRPRWPVRGPSGSPRSGGRPRLRSTSRRSAPPPSSRSSRPSSARTADLETQLGGIAAS